MYKERKASRRERGRYWAALAASRTIIRGILAGERVKEVKWIDEQSNEKIGMMMMIVGSGMADIFTRILIRFENDYEDGIRFVVADDQMSVFGKLPASIAHDDPPDELPEQHQDAGTFLMNELLQFRTMNTPIRFTPPKLKRDSE